MAQEYLLAIAGACLLAAATIAIASQAKRRQYQPRHTGELQAVAEHVGATEEWSPRHAVETAPPSPPVDPHILLAEAEAELIRATRRRDQLRAVVEAMEAQPLRIALDALQQQFQHRLWRAGRDIHAEVDTQQWSKADIRRIVRTGAPR